nr:MAG TPA: hypothetical protein [Caudoviricetes sp.]
MNIHVIIHTWSPFKFMEAIMSNIAIKIAS